MSISINRPYIARSFKTLHAYAKGEEVHPDDLAAAKDAGQWTCLLGDYLLTFDERYAAGEYRVLVAEEPDRFTEVDGPLGGIAVGTHIIIPERPPVGSAPAVLLRLVCPEPSYKINLFDIEVFSQATTVQGVEEAAAYLMLTEGAITVPGRSELEQPLQVAGEMRLSTLASQDSLYCPPYVPIAPAT